jgi:hypothetical protein
MPQPLLNVAGLGDLQQMTLPELNRLRITEIATDLQKFLVMGDLLTKGNTITVDSGKSFQWDVMVNDSGTAANVGLGYQDKTSIVDTTVQATADWRHSRPISRSSARRADEREPGEDRGPDAAPREGGDDLAGAVLMENNFFGPPPSVSDTVTLWGLRTWITKNASEGFNGGAPSGYTTIGLNPTTYPAGRTGPPVHHGR